MKVIQKSPDILIVRTESVFAVATGVISLLFALLAVYSWFRHAATVQEDIFFGQAMAALLFLLFALAFYERSEYVFDRKRRVFDWAKRTVFTRRGGCMDFDGIRSIVIQECLGGDDDNRSVRVAIIMDKETLPLTKAYTGSGSRQMMQIAKKLNRWVLGANPDLVIESIRASLAEGNRIAVTVALRRAYALSLGEAKEILDHPERLDFLTPIAVEDDDEALNSSDASLLLGLLALVLLVCGPLFLFLGINGYLKAMDTLNWVQAEAEVTQSSLRREVESDEFEFYLEYRYSVGRVDYTSNVLYIQPIMNSKKSYSVIPKFYLASGDVVNPRDYRKGKKIGIYYDPAEPENAVVFTGVKGGVWLMLAVGALFSLLYLFLARLDAYRKRMRKPQF